MAVSVTQQIDDVVSATLPAYLPTVIDNIFKSIPFTIRLIEKDNISLDGGTEIRQPFIFDDLPTGWYIGEDLLTVQSKQTQTAMRFDWKFAYASLKLPATELLLNSGTHAITNLVTTKMQTMEMSLRQRIATSIFSDGTAAGGKEIVGLAAAVNNTGTYGGIDRSTTEGAVLKANVDSTGGPLTLDLLQASYGAATLQPEQPDLCVTTQAQFNRLWSQCQAAQRFQAAPGLLGEVGFSSIRFNGMDIIVDQKCPAGTAFLLNTKWWKMIFHPQRRFEIAGPFSVTNEDSTAYRCHVAMCLLCTSPRLQAVIKNLDE